MLHCIAEGEAGEGVRVACFDGCKPDGRDRVTSGGVVEMDKSTDTWEDVRVGSLRYWGGGHGVDTSVWGSGV
jgi:hypothetical protein